MLSAPVSHVGNEAEGDDDDDDDDNGAMDELEVSLTVRCKWGVD